MLNHEEVAEVVEAVEEAMAEAEAMEEVVGLIAVQTKGELKWIP